METQFAPFPLLNGYDAEEQRYTVIAAAELLNVSTNTIYDGLSPNSTQPWDVALRSIGKTNSRWLLPKSALLAWNEARLANLGLITETEKTPEPAPQSYIETSLVPQPLVTATEQEVMGHIVKMIEDRVRRKAEEELRYEQVRNVRLTDFLKSLRTVVDTFLVEEQNRDH